MASGTGLQSTRSGRATPEGWRRVVAGEDWPNGGGERASEVQRRVLEAMEALRVAEPEGRLAIVSHLATLRALFCAVAGRELTLRWPPLAAGSLSEVRWPMAGAPEIISLNETGHLREH
ncbi:MAG: histidine phosphatase family protein [Ardenticatenaceae bacterium]|nr:histidine phosphatase family protein [Ardenticatenaceae bacterium]